MGLQQGKTLAFSTMIWIGNGGGQGGFQAPLALPCSCANVELFSVFLQDLYFTLVVTSLMQARRELILK
jgi:hypothetical protein